MNNKIYLHLVNVGFHYDKFVLSPPVSPDAPPPPDVSITK